MNEKRAVNVLFSWETIVIEPPQVRLKMNEKKPSQFQFHFSGVLEAFSMLKKFKKKNLLAWTLEIIKRWSEAESFTIFENHAYSH